MTFYRHIVYPLNCCRRQMSEEDDIELILHDAGKEKETSEEKELDEEEEYLVEYDEDGEEEEEEEEDYGMELITTGLLDREPVLSAVPPRVIQHDEGQMEVSTSPAFQCIDDVSIILFYLIFYLIFIFVVFHNCFCIP